MDEEVEGGNELVASSCDFDQVPLEFKGLNLSADSNKTPSSIWTSQNKP